METPQTVGISDSARIQMYERAIQQLSEDLQHCRAQLGQQPSGLFGQGGRRHNKKHRKSAAAKKSRKHRASRKHRKTARR